MLLILSELVVLFFFFKQKTAYEMRISDWSSDVCSADLFQDAMQGAFSGGPFAEIAKRNMEMFGAATSAFKGATSEKKASTAAEEKDDEIAQLKAQLELLNSKIDRLGKP